MDLSTFVSDFAAAMTSIDRRQPQWTSTTGRTYMAGIGPHPEVETVRLVAKELRTRDGYPPIRIGVPYPEVPRQKCDLVIGDADPLAIEVKMLRFFGDNGKPNDNILMHILSPYPQHRSALTDCTKLSQSGFGGNLAIVIYGYDYPTFKMDPAIEAFETLARRQVDLGERTVSHFADLCHPIHRTGRVLGWPVRP